MKGIDFKKEAVLPIKIYPLSPKISVLAHYKPEAIYGEPFYITLKIQNYGKGDAKIIGLDKSISHFKVFSRTY